MSVQFVEKLFKEALKRQLDPQKGREAQIGATGQLFVVNEAQYQKLIDHLTEVHSRDKGAVSGFNTKATAKEMVDIARQHALVLEQEFMKLKSSARIAKERTFPYLRDALISKLGPEYAKLGNGNPNRDIFLVQYFRSKPSDKKFGIDEIKKALYEYLGVQTRKRAVLQEQLSADKQKKTSPGTVVTQTGEYFDKGHGGFGHSVSVTQSGMIIQAIEQELGVSPKDIDEVLRDIASNSLHDIKVSGPLASLIEQVRVSYRQVVDVKTGTGLKVDYVAAVELEFFHDNISASAAEKEIKDVFRNKIGPYIAKRVLDTPGSSTLREKINKAILVDAFIANLKNPTGVTVKVSGKLRSAGRESAGDFTLQGKKADPKVSIGAGRGKVTMPAIRRKRETSASPVSFKALIPLINAQLTETIVDNMGFPSLINRTGRFASSAKVVDIIKTPQGYPSVLYTYQRNPYQIFEYPTGDPNRATVDRDPRKIIERSIRDIAIGLINSRFYARRI